MKVLKGAQEGSIAETLTSALCEATACGNLLAMELLLLRARVPASCQRNGMRPIEYAALNDQVDATRLLLKHGAARDAIGLHAARAISHRRSQLASASPQVAQGAPALESQAGALYRQQQVAKLLAQPSRSTKCSVQ